MSLIEMMILGFLSARSMCGYELLNGHDVHFFYCDAGNPLSAEQIDDPYRKGIITVHDAQIAAELEWLRSMLEM